MIYFIRYGTQRLVKIGHAKGHPRYRLATMQTGCPVTLFLLGMAPGGPDVEREWHQRFAHLRVRGEWFKWTGELIAAAKPHLCDQFGKKMRRIEEENGLPLTPQWGTKAARNRIYSLQS